MADSLAGLAPQKDRFRDDVRYSDRPKAAQTPEGEGVDRSSASKAREGRKAQDRDEGGVKDRAFSDCLAAAETAAGSQPPAAREAAAGPAKPGAGDPGGTASAPGAGQAASTPSGAKATNAKLILDTTGAGLAKDAKFKPDPAKVSPQPASAKAGGEGQAAPAKNGKLRGKLAELESSLKKNAAGPRFGDPAETLKKAAAKAEEGKGAQSPAEVKAQAGTPAAASPKGGAKPDSKKASQPEKEGAKAAGADAKTVAHNLFTQAAANAASGNAEGSAAKARKAGGDEGGLQVSVTDLRKAGTKKEASRSAKGDEAVPGNAIPSSQAGNAKDKTAELDLKLDAGAISGQGGKGEGLAAEGAKPETLAPARDFASVLGEQLKAGWNQDIASTAHIVLKDGDSGTIKLRLHPESLGGVKIELNLADNSISGKIIVESDEAKTAFERNMAQLQDAFTQSGFDSAKLEVQVGSGNANEAGAGGERAREPFWSERRGFDSLAAAVPEAGASAYSAMGRSAVNILA